MKTLIIGLLIAFISYSSLAIEFDQDKLLDISFEQLSGDKGNGGDEYVFDNIVPFVKSERIRNAKLLLEDSINIYLQNVRKSKLPYTLKMAMENEVEYLLNIGIDKSFLLIPGEIYTMRLDFQDNNFSNLLLNGAFTNNKIGYPIYFSEKRVLTFSNDSKRLSFNLAQEIPHHVLPVDLNGDNGEDLIFEIAKHITYGNDLSEESKDILKPFFGYSLRERTTETSFYTSFFLCWNTNPGGWPDILARKMLANLDTLDSQEVRNYIDKGANINYIIDPVSCEPYNSKYSNTLLSKIIESKKLKVLEVLLQEKTLNTNVLIFHPELDAIVPAIYGLLTKDTQEHAVLMLSHPNTIRSYTNTSFSAPFNYAIKNDLKKIIHYYIENNESINIEHYEYHNLFKGYFDYTFVENSSSHYIDTAIFNLENDKGYDLVYNYFIQKYNNLLIVDKTAAEGHLRRIIVGICEKALMAYYYGPKRNKFVDLKKLIRRFKEIIKKFPSVLNITTYSYNADKYISVRKDLIKEYKMMYPSTFGGTFRAKGSLESREKFKGFFKWLKNGI